jgi:serine/threonine protein kinase
MKQVCLACRRTELDRNLFCQELYCPAEMSPTILAVGDTMSDFEIIKPVITLRSSALYEAQHQKKKDKVYLKIAHPGAEHKERLKREAEFLAFLQKDGKVPPPTIPKLLPPYVNTTLAQDSYGKTMLGGHLLYFCLFEFVEGEPLSDVLGKQPQMWITHVGWIVSRLAATINFLHLNNIYHLGLSPESVLLRFDKDPYAPRILLYDLGISADHYTIADTWYPSFVLPAYTSPELTPGNGRLKANYKTDVYGVGLILYEMLIGQPTFPYHLRGDAEVYEDVRRGRRVRMRREDADQVGQIAVRATDVEPDRRVEDANVLSQELTTLFGEAPPPKKSRMPSRATLLVVGGAILAIIIVIVIALSLN